MKYFAESKEFQNLRQQVPTIIFRWAKAQFVVNTGLTYLALGQI